MSAPAQPAAEVGRRRGGTPGHLGDLLLDRLADGGGDLGEEVAARAPRAARPLAARRLLVEGLQVPPVLLGEVLERDEVQGRLDGLGARRRRQARGDEEEEGDLERGRGLGGR